MVGSNRILICTIPDCTTWSSTVLNELENGKEKLQHSHLIDGRWENSYLSIDDVTSVRVPMLLARDLVKEKWNISLVTLFEPLSVIKNPNPPFWFNIAKVGEKTGVHDHAKFACVSAVVYLQCETNCGDLFFPHEGEDDLKIIPKVGKMVIFPSYIKHGVHINQSSSNRISLAFNLFPFPLPSEEW